MARTFSSVDEINRHRKKRKRLYKQAVEMHRNGELSDAEFMVIKKKHKKTLLRLKKAETELNPAKTDSSSEPEGSSPVFASDGKPAPHKRVEPSSRDIAILSAKREVPESVVRPRNNELADLVKPRHESGNEELEQIKELYQRELFVKEKLRQRLDEESETRIAMSDQILVVTKAKDEASMRSKASRKAAEKMKKVAIGLFVVTGCLFLMLVVMYVKDIQERKQRIADQKGTDTLIAEKDGELEKLNEKLGELEKAERELKLQLTGKQSDYDTALREQQRLEKKLKETRSTMSADVRKYDLIGLNYTLLQKEQPKLSDEELLKQTAALHSMTVAQVRQALSDYTARPAGNIASGITELLNGGTSKNALAMLKEAVLREEHIFKKLLRLAALLAEEERMKEERVQFLQTASALDPSDVYLRLELAEAFVGVGNIEYAIANFKICFEELPERGDVALRLGHLMERKGKAEEALAIYEKGLSKSSDDRDLLTAVAGLKVQKGQYVEAVRLLNHCISISDDSTRGIGNVHFNLSFAYVGLGQLEKAKAHCEKAKELGTDVTALESFLKTAQ